MKHLKSSVMAQAVISLAMGQMAYAQMAVAATRKFPTKLDAYKAPAFAGGPNLVHALYQDFDITTAFAITNTLDVGYLPKGAVPIGGYMACVDLDTGTEVLDLDLGITSNGVDSADPDFFINGGVFNGDSIGADQPLTNAANIRFITGGFPVQQLGAKTLVQILCNAIAAAGGTGRLAVCVLYMMPGEATSHA